MYQNNALYTVKIEAGISKSYSLGFRAKFIQEIMANKERIPGQISENLKYTISKLYNKSRTPIPIKPNPNKTLLLSLTFGIFTSLGLILHMHLFKKRPKFIYSINYMIPSVLVFDASLIHPLRAQKIKDSLLAEKIIKRKDIIEAHPIPLSEFRCIYSAKMIESLKDMNSVSEQMNLYLTSEIDYLELLEFYTTSCDGTYKALQYAVQERTLCFNLSGGFHHASKTHSARFCLLNDVFYAIKKAEKDIQDQSILIIDTDYHQGDGNISFLDEFPNVSMISIDIQHDEQNSHARLTSVAFQDSTSFADYKSQLISSIDKVKDPDIIIYLAGYDLFKEDSLTHGPFSENEILERDAHIFSHFKGKAFVFLPAGGYGINSWKLTLNSIKNYVKKIH